MAQLMIRLVLDPETARPEILLDLCSDADVLPLEHEQQHWALAEQLLPGLRRASREERVVVERERDLSPVALSGG